MSSHVCPECAGLDVESHTCLLITVIGQWECDPTRPADQFHRHFRCLSCGHEWASPLSPLVVAGDALRTLAAVQTLAIAAGRGTVTAAEVAEQIVAHCRDADPELTRDCADAADIAARLILRTPATPRRRRAVPAGKEN